VTGIAFGAIVLTDFPLTDLTAAKHRPALVISTEAAYSAASYQSDMSGMIVRFASLSQPTMGNTRAAS
jgi:hypothetical protein